MKTSIYLGIAIRIIVLFTVAIFMTFLPDYLRDFFGDTRFIPDRQGFGSKNDGVIDTEWVWGTRHYFYFCMCTLLFILSAINIVVASREQIIKEYFKPR